LFGLANDGSNQAQIRTQAHDSGTNTTGANVQHRNGNYYDVGMNVSPVLTGSTRSITAADAGATIDLSGNFTLTVPTGLPPGMWVNIVVEGVTAQIAPGAGMFIRVNGQNISTGNVRLRQYENYRLYIQDDHESWLMGSTGAIDANQQGYKFTDGGIIEQWGRVASVGGNSTTTVPFVIPFPTECFNVQFTSVSSESGLTAERTLNAQPTAASFVINNRANTSVGIHWTAIGR
jgi:hypothetical protein